MQSNTKSYVNFFIIFFLVQETFWTQILSVLPSGNNRKKNGLKECFFVYSALKIQCQVVKNTLSQTAFSGFLPAG